MSTRDTSVSLVFSVVVLHFTTEYLARRSRQPNGASRCCSNRRTSNKECRTARAVGSVATQDANIQEVYETANSQTRNQSNQTSRVILRLFVTISSFFLRRSFWLPGNAVPTGQPEAIDASDEHDAITFLHQS
jgi:hypothetical protein